MKAHLMFKNADFVVNQFLPANADQLVHDLDLETLLTAMAGKDELVKNVSKVALLDGLDNPADITYRQRVLADCLEHPEIVREIYYLAVNAIQEQRKMFWFNSRNSPTGMMSQSPQVIGMYMGYLKRLRAIVDEHSDKFGSEGWATLFRVLKDELGDDYFQLVDDHLKQLKFKNGTLISARLSFGNTGLDYVLRDSRRAKQTMREMLGVGGRKSYSFEIAPRDEAGSKMLNDLMNRGVNSAANSLTGAADHLANYFVMLRTELAFYVGCLNLRERLSTVGEPVCVPMPHPWSPARLSFTGLYDVCLSLRNNQRVVGNDANADGRTLIVVTGANSGGKSTFLRSVGVAHLMMRAGMNVAAESFEASTCEGIFTHFVREEDASMTSGKLDEELARMSIIADEIKPHCVVLFNESFSATNEREGSEIARQVIQALVDSDIRPLVVTHLFDLAERFYLDAPDTTLFLQAGRETDARRTFKVLPGKPLPTSFAEDVFERIGGW
ncbi:MAG TPA: hypothetical protein VGG17_10515 [Acidimicrobiales bacterium]|jgi:DNA mismatch repair ATPase MutS